MGLMTLQYEVLLMRNKEIIPLDEKGFFATLDLDSAFGITETDISDEYEWILTNRVVEELWENLLEEHKKGNLNNVESFTLVLFELMEKQLQFLPDSISVEFDRKNKKIYIEGV